MLKSLVESIGFCWNKKRDPGICNRKFILKKLIGDIETVFTHAIVRKPCRNFDQGITTSGLGPPDYALMIKQHQAYVDALESLGLEVIMLDGEPDFPDAYFVEDTAVVTPRVAVITRPGAIARQGEENSIASTLSPYRTMERIHAPGTVDGGDVLMVGDRFYVGVSDRTNPEGAEQLCAILKQYGHDPYTIEVAAGLHLKSSLNVVGENTLLLTPSFSRMTLLKEFDKIVLDRAESYAANTLLLNDHLIMPKGFPDTQQKLEKLGYPLITLDVSEVQKMDGGLTCLSIRF